MTTVPGFVKQSANFTGVTSSLAYVVCSTVATVVTEGDVHQVVVEQQKGYFDALLHDGMMKWSFSMKKKETEVSWILGSQSGRMIN